MNYPRRQQYRRLGRAVAAAGGSAAAGLLTLTFVSVGAISLAGVMLLATIGLGLYARHWLRLAGRSAVGARSEEEVRRVLAALEKERWRIRHSLAWRGRGDVDMVAIAPSRIAFAIETKTRRYDEHHLARVRGQAVWLWRRRQRWCRRGAVPVLCVVRARGVQHWEAGVLVVSLDRLTATLQSAAQHL